MVKILLVIECTERVNWYKIFQGVKVHGEEEIQVEQGSWQDISVVTYNDSCRVSLNKAKNPHPGTSQEQVRTITPDFILMRSVTRSVGHLDDRNKLYALKFANIPSVNSLHSCYMVLERPWMFSELKKLEKKLGHEKFPLINQTYYSSSRQMVISPGFPCVVKIGPYHSGYGKIRLENDSQFADIRGIVAMHDDYCTAEPFVEWDYDLRIQKIGPYYRALKRYSPNWKGNVGNQSINEDTEVTPLYKMWADECSKLFGGLDILAVDALHSKADGKEYILELNDTAIGLANRYEEEDYRNMMTVVLTRMEQTFKPPSLSVRSQPSSSSPAKEGEEGEKKGGEEEVKKKEGEEEGGGGGGVEGEEKKQPADKEDEISMLQMQLNKALQEKRDLEEKVSQYFQSQSGKGKGKGKGTDCKTQ